MSLFFSNRDFSVIDGITQVHICSCTGIRKPVFIFTGTDCLHTPDIQVYSKKIACKHTTYRLSQSPFFPLYQGGNLRFPVPAGTLAVHPCHQAIYTSYKEHFPIQIQYRQVPISHSTMFLRISPTIVGFIWVSALFRCEDNFFMLLL